MASTSGGTSIVLRGRHLAGVHKVWFGGVRATSLHHLGARRLRVTAPSHQAGTVAVRVMAHGHRSRAAAFSYVATTVPPVVTSVTPATGRPGDVVTVLGSGFDGLAAISFGGAPASWQSVSPTALVVVVPAHADGTVQVQVTARGGTSSAGPGASFGFVTIDAGPPVVSSIYPTLGPAAGGTVVRIYGTDLSHATRVLFGGVPAAQFGIDATGHLLATAPPHQPGSAGVQVVNSRGPSATSQDFFYDAPQPLVRQVEPYRGPPAGGTRITVTGSGFTWATQVLFAGVPGTGLTVLSDSQLQVTAPAHLQPAAVDVEVGNGFRRSYSNLLSSSYTYYADPHVQIAPLPPNADQERPQLSLGDVACPAVGVCVAVGDYTAFATRPFRRGLVETLTEGEWRPTPLVPPDDIADDSDLYGLELRDVECPAPDMCIAVGDYQGSVGNRQAVEVRPLVYRWDGSTWSVVPIPVRAGAYTELDKLRCVSTDSCVALGTSCGRACLPYVATMAGTTWSGGALAPPRGFGSPELDDFDCWAPLECEAVGSWDPDPTDPQSGLRALLAHLDGDHWSFRAGTLPADASSTRPDFGLDVVSCTVDGCHAMGGYRLVSTDRQGYLSTITGAGETTERLPLPADAASDARVHTSAIECVTFEWCRTLVHYQVTDGYVRTLDVTIQPGSVTLASVPPPPGPPQYVTSLDALICPSNSGCAAVGGHDYTQLAATDVTTHVDAPTAPAPDGNSDYAYDLDAIAADSAATAVAVGDGGPTTAFRLGVLVTGIPIPTAVP